MNRLADFTVYGGRVARHGSLREGTPALTAWALRQNYGFQPHALKKAPD